MNALVLVWMEGWRCEHVSVDKPLSPCPPIAAKIAVSHFDGRTGATCTSLGGQSRRSHTHTHTHTLTHTHGHAHAHAHYTQREREGKTANTTHTKKIPRSETDRASAQLSPAPPQWEWVALMHGTRVHAHCSRAADHPGRTHALHRHSTGTSCQTEGMQRKSLTYPSPPLPSPQHARKTACVG